MLSSPEGRSTSIVSVTDRDSIHSNEGMAVPSPRVVLPVVHIESTSDSDDWTTVRVVQPPLASPVNTPPRDAIDDSDEDWDSPPPVIRSTKPSARVPTTQQAVDDMGVSSSSATTPAISPLDVSSDDADFEWDSLFASSSKQPPPLPTQPKPPLSPVIMKDDWEDVQPAQQLINREKQRKSGIPKVEDPWGEETPSARKQTRRHVIDQRVRPLSEPSNQRRISRGKPDRPLNKTSNNSALGTKKSSRKPAISDWTDESSDEPPNNAPNNTVMSKRSSRKPAISDWTDESSDEPPNRTSNTILSKKSSRKPAISDWTDESSDEPPNNTILSKKSSRKPTNSDWTDESSNEAQNKAPNNTVISKRSSRKPAISDWTDESSDEPPNRTSNTILSKKSSRKPAISDWTDESSDEPPNNTILPKNSSRKPTNSDWTNESPNEPLHNTTLLMNESEDTDFFTQSSSQVKYRSTANRTSQRHSTEFFSPSNSRENRVSLQLSHAPKLDFLSRQVVFSTLFYIRIFYFSIFVNKQGIVTTHPMFEYHLAESR